MEYKASLGTTARIITASVSILFAFIALFSFTTILDTGTDLLEKLQTVFIVLLLFVIYIFCYLYRPLYYLVDHQNITVHRPIKNVKMSLTEIAEVFQAAPESMKWSIRTFGNGGLFGLYGKFWNKKYGSMTWYATRTDNLIVIVSKASKKIVLTPDDISMLEEVKRRLHPLNMHYDQ